MEYLQVAKDLVNEIGKAKELTSGFDINEVFLSLENIVAFLAYLIKPLADLEQEYRKEALPIEDESQAKAEARAKAGDKYKEWRKLDSLMELAREQIMILKKFREDIAFEKKVA